MSLPPCSICEHKADPRMGLLSLDSDYYPLCDGCALDDDSRHVVVPRRRKT